RRLPVIWRPISRRSFALSSGATLLASPFVRAAGGRADEAVPKRLIIFYAGAGNVHEDWRPRGGETTFELWPIPAPLAPFKNDLLIIEGLDNKLAYDDNTFDHNGIVNLMTGNRRVPTDPGRFVSYAEGPSIDQFIAARIGTGSVRQSLQLAVTQQGT